MGFWVYGLGFRVYSTSQALGLRAYSLGFRLMLRVGDVEFRFQDFGLWA